MNDRKGKMSISGVRKIKMRISCIRKIRLVLLKVSLVEDWVGFWLKLVIWDLSV